MRLHFTYTNYPLSPELTQKSRSIAELTHPLYGVMAGGLLWFAIMALAFELNLPVPDGLLFFSMVAFAIAGAILIVKYRKKRFAQLDAEYEKIVQASQR